MKCLVRLVFIPNGLMYSTPQKRCCIRTQDGNTKVLDAVDVVKRCMEHEERAYRIHIDRFKGQQYKINSIHFQKYRWPRSGKNYNKHFFGHFEFFRNLIVLARIWSDLIKTNPYRSFRISIHCIFLMLIVNIIYY